MKILWLCNVMLPVISQDLGRKEVLAGGWLTGMLNPLLNMDNISIGICFPLGKENKLVYGQTGRIEYYGFPQRASAYHKYDRKTEMYLQKAIDDFEPDIVHIFGTEYPHSLAMTKVFGHPERTVISIQGLISICAKHYYADLPGHIISRYTFRDFIRQDNIRQQKKKFSKRGVFETEALKNVNHVIGRTDMDESCTSQINPDIKYHFCNETLRNEFYKHSWDIDKCDKHTIFVSQAGYPLKGFHHMLEAAPYILQRFPDMQIYTTGKDVFSIPGYRISSYQKYIAGLINKNGLADKVHFLGDLSEQQMCERYLKTHVFVSASSIENSSNSLSEAMLLGVPAVSSDVGGIKNLLTHNEEGFVYQHDAPYMLAYYVCKLFSDPGLAVKISRNAKRHAEDTHNIMINSNRLMEIYSGILNTLPSRGMS